MKNLFKPLIIVAILCISFQSIASIPHKKIDSNNEILLVEVYLVMGSSGIYIFHNDKPTEVIPLSLISKKAIESNGQLIKKKFQELYDSGWKLTSTSGGDQIQRYIFVK